MLFIKIISILALSLFKIQINGDTEIKCTQEFCLTYTHEKGCPELNDACLAMNATHHGTFLKYPDVCNCCDYCLKNLGPGADCMRGIPGLQPKSTSICGPGLSCTMNNNGSSTCQQLKTQCTQARDDWDKRRVDGTLGMTEVQPKCDGDGWFAPQYCIPGSICYCIAPDGKRIFGEIPFLDSWDEQTMTCGCSLNAWKMRNTLDINHWEDEHSVTVLGARCTENGLFDPLQCMSGEKAKCFCVDPVTGRPNEDPLATVIVSNITVGKPPCFDESRHKSGVYETPCELMKLSSKRSSKYGTDLFENPICQPDGMFHRLQIAGSRKICVDPSGKQIIHNGTNYGADVDSPEAEIMDCNCAKNVWLLSEAGVSELPKCCSFGNFEAWQCRRNLCYCVDCNGLQVGLEVHYRDVTQLSCYNGGEPCTKPLC